MIGRFLETLYTKVFINIVVENLQSVVFVEIRSKKEVVSSVHKVFETTTINTKMFEFISAYIKESPYNYISILDKSPNQGALRTCDASLIGKYLDTTAVEHKCYSQKWTFYSSEYDIEAIKHEYRSIGVDFIFSPFVVLADFFRDKIDSAFAMFILVEDSYMSLCIFDKSDLLFARHLDMRNHKDEDDILIDASLEDDMMDFDGIDLEDVSISSDEPISFDDFTNIEDLDEGEDIDEFSQINEVEETKAQKEVDISSGGFNEDYHRFSLIQSTLNTFYKDPDCESRFIETVYIADGIGLSGDLKNFLEEEMFLNVHVRKIDIAASLSELAKAELDAL